MPKTEVLLMQHHSQHLTLNHYFIDVICIKSCQYSTCIPQCGNNTKRTSIITAALLVFSTNISPNRISLLLVLTYLPKILFF